MKLHGDEKILIIKPSALGDILHSLAVVGAIKKEYPDIRIGWVVNRDYAALLEQHPLIDTVYVFDRKKWGKLRYMGATLREFPAFMRSIRNEKYDYVIDLQGLFRSGLVTAFSGARLKIGLSDAREGSRLAYSHVITVHDKKRHAVDRYLKTVNYFEIQCDDCITFPVYWSKHDEKRVDELCRQNGLTNGSLVIGLNPNARWGSKCWPEEHFAQLGDMLYEKLKAKVVFVGSPADRQTAEAIVSAMKHRPVDAVGQTSLLELGALLKRMECLVTNDSGPMHMAVAVGTPVVALFGPTDPQKTGPYGNGHAVIQKNLSCAACMRRSCMTRKCMSDISVDEVFEHVRTLLSEKKNRPQTSAKAQ